MPTVKSLVSLAPILFGLCGGHLANAAGVVTATKVVELALDENSAEQVFLEITKPVSGSPTCATNASWHFVLDLRTPTGAFMYSVLVSAFLNDSFVDLRGTGACSLAADIETLRRVEIFVPF